MADSMPPLAPVPEDAYPPGFKDFTDEMKHSWFEDQIEHVVRRQKARLQHLKQFGIEPDNVAGSRHEQFINFLLEIGVISQIQLDEFNLRQSVQLLQVLDGFVQQVDAQQARVQLTHGTPADRRRGGIVLPPGVRKPN